MTVKRRSLAERRRVVGHTQEQLAALLGVERSTVVRWEAGETTPQPWCRPKLAEALAVSVDELDAMLAEGQTVDDGRSSSSEPRSGDELPSLAAANELSGDLERDPVLVPPWNHRGTVEVAIVLGGGDRVKRRPLVFLAGMALTAPAHQWLVHEPGPLVSGLSGRRVSPELADRLPPMIASCERWTMSEAAVRCSPWLSTSSAGSPGCWIRPPTMSPPAASSTSPSPNSESLCRAAGAGAALLHCRFASRAHR